MISNHKATKISAGQIWEYTKPNPTNGATGDRYKIVATGLMKVGSGTEWVPAVTYYVAGDNPQVKTIFTRDEGAFRESFQLVG